MLIINIFCFQIYLWLLFSQKNSKPNCSDYMDVILMSQSAIPIKQQNGTQEC